MNVPLNEPLPALNVAASCEVVLFMVPAMNGPPDAVHVTLPMAIELAPDARSPLASTFSVGVPLDRTFAVTDTVVLAGMLGVAVGSASGKLMVVGVSVSSARLATLALIVSVWVVWALAAVAPNESQSAPDAAAESGWSHRTVHSCAAGQTAVLCAPGPVATWGRRCGVEKPCLRCRYPWVDRGWCMPVATRSGWLAARAQTPTVDRLERIVPGRVQGYLLARDSTKSAVRLQICAQRVAGPAAALGRHSCGNEVCRGRRILGPAEFCDASVRPIPAISGSCSRLAKLPEFTTPL